MYPSSAIAVFTTVERYDYFSAAVGVEADFRLDPRASIPFELELTNLAGAGAAAVVIDDAHFMSVADMVSGIAAFLNNPAHQSSKMRLIVVCPHRMPGDIWLSYLAGYCGVYDIIFNCEGVQITMALLRLLDRPNTRLDVLDILESGWNTLYASPDTPDAPGPRNSKGGLAGEAGTPACGRRGQRFSHIDIADYINRSICLELPERGRVGIRVSFEYLD